MKRLNDFYESPKMEVVEVKQEGVICASGEISSTMDDTFEEITL